MQWQGDGNSTDDNNVIIVYYNNNSKNENLIKTLRHRQIVSVSQVFFYIYFLIDVKSHWLL